MVGRHDGTLELAGVEVEIEEAVIGFLEIDKLAAVAPEADFAAEFFDFGERSDAVGLAVEEDHGWQLAADQAHGVPHLFDLVFRETSDGLCVGCGIDQGAEEDECLGLAGNAVHGGEVFGFWESGEQCRSGTAGRATDDEFFGIDDKGVVVMAEPAEEVACVFDGFDRAGAVVLLRAGFGDDGDGAPADKVQAVGDELGGCCGVPESAVEENHDGAWCCGGLWWEEHVCVHGALGAFLIDIGGGIAHQLAIARLPDGCHSFQDSTHIFQPPPVSVCRVRFVCCGMRGIVQSFPHEMVDLPAGVGMCVRIARADRTAWRTGADV